MHISAAHLLRQDRVLQTWKKIWKEHSRTEHRPAYISGHRSSLSHLIYCWTLALHFPYYEHPNRVTRSEFKNDYLSSQLSSLTALTLYSSFYRAHLLHTFSMIVCVCKKTKELFFPAFELCVQVCVWGKSKGKLTDSIAYVALFTLSRSNTHSLVHICRGEKRRERKKGQKKSFFFSVAAAADEYMHSKKLYLLQHWNSDSSVRACILCSVSHIPSKLSSSFSSLLSHGLWNSFIAETKIYIEKNCVCGEDKSHVFYAFY